MQANYYVVLGLLPDANAAQIKRAFRARVRPLHPEQDEAIAQQYGDAKEALDALMHPLERARHDRVLAAQRQRTPSYLVSPVPLDILRDFERHTPSMEQIIDLFARNFQPEREPKVQHTQAVNIEVLLTPEEAAHGGAVALAVPIFRPCPTCGGSGRAGSAECDVCDGRGTDRVNSQVDVIIPAHTADGTEIPVSLNHLGIRNLLLNVLVRVTAPPA